MRHVLPALGLAFLLASSLSPEAAAQARRLQFLNELRPNQKVSGLLKLGVGTDPIRRPKWVRVGIEVEGRSLDFSDRLPWEYTVDTATLPNGDVTLRLVLVDGHTNQRETLDTLNLLVENTPKRSPEKKPETSAETKPAPRPETAVRVDPPKQEPTKPEPARAPAVTLPEPASRTEPKPAVAQTPDPLPMQVEAAAKDETGALSLPATAMAAHGGKLYLGRKDGSVTVYDPTTGQARNLPAPADSGETKAILAASGGVWWLCAPGPSKVAAAPGAKVQTASATLNNWQEKDGRRVSVTLEGMKSLAGARLSSWRGQVAVFGVPLGAVVDANGRVSPLDSVLPPEVSAEARTGSLLLAEEGGRRLAAVVKGGRLSAWVAQGSRWSEAESRPVPSGPWALTARGIAWADRSAVREQRLQEDGPEPAPVPYPTGEGMTRPVSALAASGSDVWTLRGRTVFHANTETGAANAFLPWNVAGLTPSQIVADKDGAWVATNKGVRRIALNGKPDAQEGYGGFVRARLDSEQDRPASDVAQALVAEIDSWKGTPYLYGGSSRDGIDCSGFVMRAFEGAGIALPHGSSNLRTCSPGLVVKDELRWGDVLVYPGHCAIYIGNGLTAETANKQVGGRSIWFRESVVVRRFLDVPDVPVAPASMDRGDISTRKFASRGGYRMNPHRPKKKAAPTQRNQTKTRTTARGR